ncbi:TBC1 domain family member-like protein [Emericellopsis cladophorae]|uniref:TBC1 domain family member-like protein n=1 Tax=Emericellopsis cladophorae TaxID=2686198 RepID=A0A9P9YA81_9HYPO|nr:TBC1 domain family member-like protein [Emericellopsis cladophorae]KAI6785804.1 TBC1 domain family member-like protein [Emericellopsis cladophorae]
MRPVDEIRLRWRATQTHGASRDDMQRAVRYTGTASPCISGLRSVCWKLLLLSKTNDTDWISVLSEARDEYQKRRDALLQYIKHPGALAELKVDPLADDPTSPWNTIRQDELIRSEIQQDVQRLPDEANYHDERIQTMILDVLFVYCKMYPDRGGYRQGMHELLAPIVHVLEADAVDRGALADEHGLDETLLDLTSSEFVEHDAYALFCKVMDGAQSFYALNDEATSRSQAQSSTIVERSKFIHEVCLQKVDPELAAHLISVEILPQIFLIRWVRLLFSREFPFDQFLMLWDTIFAVDPSLDLIDLICVSMLIRIRWQLLKADYSVCLQLLLRYPPPDEAKGPRTFVDDALHLRGHLDGAGGSTLIMKYTGKMPANVKSPDISAPSTPSFRPFNALRQRSLAMRSPLNSPPAFMAQQAGVEAILSNAAKGAKGVLDRGEKLGINQAVRDAMGEIRRNMQNFNEARYQPGPTKEILSEEGAAAALAAMEKRNLQLACMLDDTITSLKLVSAGNLAGDEEKTKSLEMIEVAAAKIQFVKIYLEDSAMEMPATDLPAPEKDVDAPGTDAKEAAAGTTVVDVDDVNNISNLSLARDAPTIEDGRAAELAEKRDTESPKPAPKLEPPMSAASRAVRPAAVPTRSTLAQSSFSWMLEPDESKKSSGEAEAKAKSPPPSGYKKRSSNSASRERNAFLFGEPTADPQGRDPLRDDIFGLEPLRKT